MISDPIFKKDSTGRIRTWQYEVDGGQWRTIAGLEDGQKVVSGWTVCTPKSQDTAEAQAQFEADAERRKKLERDYHPTVDTVDTPIIFEPMLAQTYDGKVTFPVYAQPKLDGIRCIATAQGLFSRKGKRFFAAPHIEEALAPVFEKDPDLILDGELYNHHLKDDFNTITSVVRKQKPSEKELALSAELIQYHVYDMPSFPGTFGQRSNDLYEMFDDVLGWDGPVGMVSTVHVGTLDLLDELNGQWVQLGYEGQMVRLDAPYEQKRSKALLKRKEFVTEEFPVTKVIEGVGNWAGYAKAVEFMLPGDKRLENGDRPRAGIRGDQAFAKALLTRDVKIATIRYFNLTPAGIPRFPVAIDFDRQD